MTQPFANASFDAVGCYTKVCWVLKSWSIFLCYEWYLTDQYDLGCAEHVVIKKQVKDGASCRISR